MPAPLSRGPEAEPSAPRDSHGTVALLIQGDDNYGVGQVARETLRLLPGLRCVAFCDGSEAEDVRSAGATVHVLEGGDYFRGFAPRAGAVAAIRQLVRARRHWVKCAHALHAWCRRDGVRVLHGNVWSHYFTLGALRRAHPGVYQTVWHTHNFLNMDRNLGLRARFNTWLIRRGADRLLCVSHAVAQGWGRSGVPTQVIHNSVSSRHLALPAAPAFSARRRVPLRVVGAGRMEWWKGHHVTVEAVARLRDGGVPVSLDLFGGPTENNGYVDWLRRRIHQLRLDGAVTFHGYTGDLVQRLADYDVAVQARIDPEPCGLYVLECMALGMPIVASAGGGTPELVRDGREGRLYPPGNAAALADGLAALLADPTATDAMAEAARRRCHAEFSPARFARKLSDFYAEVGRHRSPIDRIRGGDETAYDLRRRH